MMLALLLAAAAAPPPVAGPVQDLKKVVVDAIRNCGQSEGDEITVCARDRGIAESYRLPKISPRYAEAGPIKGRLDTLVDAGASGQGSCSAVGAAGATGCTIGAAKDWGAWKRQHKAEGQLFPW